MIDSMPKYQAHISREGHNLSHSFEFTSSTGHLLTLFADILNPDDTISGNIQMFSRTNPLNVPANVEVDQFIDYFFVPLEMLYSGFGDSLFMVNEPYSSMISVQVNNNLPIVNFDNSTFGILKQLFQATDSAVSNNTLTPASKGYINFSTMDSYGKDSMFLSFYRNMFHNYMNPNSLFYEEFKATRNRPKASFSVIPADIYQPNVLPLSLMAYNCCYQNFYRLDDREAFNNNLYNIDASVYNNESPFSDYAVDAFDLKYRPYFFDYFTSLKVAPLLNPNNTSPSSSVPWLAVRNYMSSLGVVDVSQAGSQSTLDKATSVAQATENSLVSTAQLRSMFAVEKILSVTNRAKKTYDSQVLAHMGAKVPRDVRHELHYLGTQRSKWKIGEVISMAGTDDTPLGDMAGKGYASFDDKKIHFTAPCHGIFIAIYSAVPRMRYYAPLEKHMQISNRLDFWFEEYEKLGMQPAFYYEGFPVLSDYSSQSMIPNSDILGWQMRYQQYKQRFDKVSPAFANTVYLDIDTPGDIHIGDYDYLFSYGNFNTWQNWVLSKRPLDLDHDSNVNLFDFLASPTDLNNIMSVQYGWFLTKDPDSDVIPSYWKFDWLGDEEKLGFTWNVASLFYRDPFIHFANLDFKKVSKMHSNTLPDLNF